MSPDILPPGPTLLDDVAWRTDAYFNRTREVIARYGDVRVTYAVFLRRPRRLLLARQAATDRRCSCLP